MNPSNLVEPFEDPTGNMSLTEINSQDISNLMDAVNGLQSSTGNIIMQPTYMMVNDGTSNRAVFGYNQTTGTWGVFAVPPGADLSDATNPQDFSLSSDVQTMIAVKTGTIVIPGLTTQPADNFGTLSATPIAHSLTYIPSMIAFTFADVILGAGPASQAMNIPLPTDFQDANLNENQIFIGTDAVNIYAFNNWESSGTGPISSYSITYYLLNVSA